MPSRTKTLRGRSSKTYLTQTLSKKDRMDGRTEERKKERKNNKNTVKTNKQKVKEMKKTKGLNAQKEKNTFAQASAGRLQP